MPGVEKALEELLGGKAKPTELAHIDVRARLELAELTHFLDLPQLWPPTVAVCPDRLSLFACVFSLVPGEGARDKSESSVEEWRSEAIYRC